jgi:hypothetical protein
MKSEQILTAHAGNAVLVPADKLREMQDEIAALRKDAALQAVIAYGWIVERDEGLPDDAQALAALTEKHLFPLLPEEMDVLAFIVAKLREAIAAAIGAAK